MRPPPARWLIAVALIIVVAFVVMEGAKVGSPDRDALELVEELVAEFNQGDAGAIEGMLADGAVASWPGTWGREIVRTSFEERMVPYVEFAAAVGAEVTLTGCEADLGHALYEVAVSCRFAYSDALRESLREPAVGGTMFVGVTDGEAAAVLTAQHGVGKPLQWSTERFGFDRWLGAERPDECLALGGRLRFVDPQCTDYDTKASTVPLLLELAEVFAAST